MAKREEVLKWVHAAAARGDTAACTRLFCEHRISRAAYDDAVTKGRNFAAWCAKNKAAQGAAVQRVSA